MRSTSNTRQNSNNGPKTGAADPTRKDDPTPQPQGHEKPPEIDDSRTRQMSHADGSDTGTADGDSQPTGLPEKQQR